MEHIIKEHGSNLKKDPASTETGIEKDDFLQFLDDLHLEQQEQG